MKHIQSKKFGITFVCVASMFYGGLYAQYQTYQGHPTYPARQSYPNQGQYQGQVIQGQYQGQVVQGQAYGQPAYPNQTSPNYYPQGQVYPQYGQHNHTPQQTLTTSHWAQNLKFGERKHDFGAVPTASKQEHVFEFENTLDSEIFLTSVRASCGCTKPKLLTQSVKPGETGMVLAKFDTKTFRGNKAATVTVSIRKDSPYTEYGELQFSVKGKIRQDVVLNPGRIQFENAKPNEDAQRTVEIMYAGDPRWALTSVKSSNPNIAVEAKETERSSTGKVTYELIVKLLGDQPIGIFTDYITLYTNDNNPGSKKMVVPVEGNIQAMIQTSPVTLGAITKDSPVKKKIVVRAQKAFRIKEIIVDNQLIKVENSDGEKSLHILDYELDTSIVGPVRSEIKIVSDLPGQATTSIPFTAQIVQPVAGDN